MNHSEFFTTLSDAVRESDREGFIASSTGSADELSRIWELAHMSIREIRTKSGLSQRKFAALFGIPRRTLEDWDAGKSAPPGYVRLLLIAASQQIGLI